MSIGIFLLITAVFFLVLRRRGHHATGALVLGMFYTGMLDILAQNL